MSVTTRPHLDDEDRVCAYAPPRTVIDGALTAAAFETFANGRDTN